MSDYAILAETAYRSVGLGVAAVTFAAFIAGFVINLRRARHEAGSETETAPNRAPEQTDEELEGPRLDRWLTFCLVCMCFIAVAFTFYMIAEPGRQEGNERVRNETFVARGETNYTERAQCVNCHAADGSGGGASYVLQDADGQFVANATWTAPALNNVLLRYSPEEVAYILNYGRSGSPMAAWGAPGGGPLTEQAILNTIEYLKTLQIQSLDPADIAAAGNDNPENEKDSLDDLESQVALEEADKLKAKITAEVERSLEAGEFRSVGEAVFNMGLYSGFGSGSYSCGRCHSSGWSLGPKVSSNVLATGIAGCGGGVTGIGFSLCSGSTRIRFPDDTWKRSDGSWLPTEGLFDDEGRQYIETADASKVYLDDQGRPADADGNAYLVLNSGLVSATGDSLSGEAVQENGGAPSTSEGVGNPGDLASCEFVSGLFTPSDGSATYPVDPATKPVVSEDGEVADPDRLDISKLSGPSYLLESGRVASGCEVVAMPPRTSRAHYDFIYSGADAGQGYGVGGQSSAGMMPAFGAVLPSEYIEALVDYERGL